MKKVLLTGITGFVGGYLHQYLLERGYIVKGTSTTQSSETIFKCHLDNKADIQAVIEAYQPNIIIHTAALSSVTRGQTLDYYIHNVVATENLIEAANQLPELERFIFFSTAGVYGNQNGIVVLHEQLASNPISHYGMC